MELRQELTKRIERKQQEVRELELKIHQAQAYIQGLQDTLRLLPKEPPGSSDAVLRPGSSLAKAQAIIRKHGRPMHVSDLLQALGRPVDRNNRASLSGSLSAYVKRGDIFTRPAPNTFGLLEFETGKGFGTTEESQASKATDQDVPF